MERVATPKNTNVYPEAVEVAENKGAEPEEIGNVRMAGIQKRKHSERLLGCRRQWNTDTYHYKRKTCTQGIL